MAQPSDSEIPLPPAPSSDPRLGIVLDGASMPIADQHDLFQLLPIDALHLLSASVELLVRMTGDVPPTPPPKTPTNPQMSDMQVEKENIARSHSEKSLAKLLRQQQQQQPTGQVTASKKGDASDVSPKASGPAAATQNKLLAYSASMTAQLKSQQQRQMRQHEHGGMASYPSQGQIDGVQLRQRPPPAHPGVSPPDESRPYIVVGADSQPVNLQHGAITRKFFSKQIPPIPIGQYLLRLHQFCPMSTAVYLATSLYIHRLAVEERAIPVTRRNAHRLVLAGLRVAMKALEDLSYPHTKIAKVGGVSDVELARLEISFCFLAGFELVVGEEPLRRHWEALRDGRAQQMLRGTEVPALTLGRMPREVPVTPAGG
ncbi:cyclin domain-containing protein [Hirsutella rhossiliensis]|uniref:Cyclin domain-containing protein n=1 Tax=Hirsutella rhossiliensis TaxID=111463 RepID=A0A9P8N1U9_9HYPO|nr:cyclin domain-containing protein [Hirsutella rhossiliensis]KAH0966103.1 cyclin domain-containing protein [Hirsutella rhossiliensis]